MHRGSMLKRLFAIAFVTCTATAAAAPQAPAAKPAPPRAAKRPAQPDLAKEKRWADQIVDAIVTGEAVWLQAGKQRFLALFTAEEGEHPKGAVVLLHGMGLHPNWPDVVYPLRTELPEHGWATLSIQLPVLPNAAKPADYAPLIPAAGPRIDAAIAYLHKAGYRDIALVAHSLGTLMAASWLTGDDHARQVFGLVAIGMPGTSANKALDAPGYLARLQLPILDLSGSRDLPMVMRGRAARLRAARKAGNRHYRQRVVAGADHFFQGLDATLVERVAAWLGARFEERHPSPAPAAQRTGAPTP